MFTDLLVCWFVGLLAVWLLFGCSALVTSILSLALHLTCLHGLRFVTSCAATLPMYKSAGQTKLSKYTYNETTSAGSSNAALLDKRGQRILRHVVSAVVVVGDTSSDALVAHRRLTKIWHTLYFYLYLYQGFFFAPGYQFKDFRFDDSISKLSLSSTAFGMFASAFTM